MGTLKLFAFLFGVAFIAIGVMGFMPVFIMDGELFGIFEVDDMHNLVHIGSGILALLAAFSVTLSKFYFQLFGLIYSAATILGFIRAGDLYIMHVNLADNVLHLAIAVIALYLGFLFSAGRGI